MGDLGYYRYHMWSVVCIPVNAECHVLQAFDLSSQSRVSSASTACVAVRQSTLDQSYPLGARPNQSWHDECCGLNRSTSDMHRLRIGQPSCLLGYPGQPNLDRCTLGVHRLGTPNVHDVHRGTSGYCSDRAPFRIVVSVSVSDTQQVGITAPYALLVKVSTHDARCITVIRKAPGWCTTRANMAGQHNHTHSTHTAVPARAAGKHKHALRPIHTFCPCMAHYQAAC
jgi:hypothetical protein